MLALLFACSAVAFTPTSKKSSTELSHARLLHDLASQRAEDLLFVKFIAPWCGFCKKLAPIWEELGQDFPGLVRSVDCTSAHGKSFCLDHGVTGYPTLILFRGGTAQPEYDGERELGALTAYMRSALEQGHPLLDLEAPQPGGDTAVFVGFFAPWCGHCQELAPKWESLRRSYKDKSKYIHITQVDCKLVGD